MSSFPNEKGRGLAKPRGLWGHRPLVCGLFCVGAEVEGGETGRFSKAPQCGAHTVLILLKNSDFIFVRYDFGVRKTYLNSILLSSMVQYKSMCKKGWFYLLLYMKYCFICEKLASEMNRSINWNIIGKGFAMFAEVGICPGPTGVNGLWCVFSWKVQVFQANRGEWVVYPVHNEASALHGKIDMVFDELLGPYSANLKGQTNEFL